MGKSTIAKSEIRVQNLQVLDNLDELRTGGIARASQAALDLLYAISATQDGRIAKGTALQYLRMNAGVTAYEFASLPAVLGKVVQIQTAIYETVAGSSSSTLADTGLTVNITPTSSSNKVLVICNVAGCGKQTGDTYLRLQLQRDGNNLGDFETSGGDTDSTLKQQCGSCSIVIMDAPASGSALTYKVQFASQNAVASALVQVNSARSSIAVLEVTPE